MRTLYVAAGGGGDAVGALLARRALGDTDERPPLVTSCAWERLRIDPIPGPRSRADFRGLGLVGGEPCEVLASSDTVPSGRSVLPRLAETSGARIFLHDFDGGVVSLTQQLRRVANSLEAVRLVVVDVGGDILARGSEPTLKSPLADSITLAAALDTGVPTTVVVLGPGADAEVPEREVLTLLEMVGGEPSGGVNASDVNYLEAVLSWHPTEATAVVAAGAEGVTGSVAMRRGQEPVPLTEHTSRTWVIRSPSFDRFPLADRLRRTTSLSDAEALMRTFAVDEIDFERTVAAQSRVQRPKQSIDDVLSDMESTGATHITSRRLFEALAMQAVDIATSTVSRDSAGLWSRADLRRVADSTGL